MAHRNLDVLDAAHRAEDMVLALIERRSGRRLLHVTQMRGSVHAIAANISEAFGRGSDRDRARVLRIARAEAEETIQHLHANYRTGRLRPNDYWPIRNLLITIVKMLNLLIRH